MPRGAAGYENQYTSKGGFGDAYHKAQQRAREGKDYRKRVRDAEVKELDEIHGSLVVPPSGQSGFDNSVQNLAMTWKKRAGENYAKFKRGEMSAEEFSASKNDLAGRAEIYKNASGNIKKNTAAFDEALQNGTISEATPPEVRDLYDSLRKGDGSFEVKDVDGVDMFVGETAQGVPVSIPLNGLASGKNMLRWTEKVDLTPQKDKIVKDLDAFKQQWETAQGDIIEGAGGLGPDGDNTFAANLADRARKKVDQILDNDATFRSVAADEYGIQIPEGASPAEIKILKDQVAQKMTSELTDQLIPRQTRVQPYRPPAQSASATATDKKQATATRKANALHNSLNKYLQTNKKLDQGALDEVIKNIGGNKVKNLEFVPKSTAFGQFFGGAEQDQIKITDAKGDVQTIPADAQGLINNVLRLEFGTAVDDTRNQIGGEVQQGETPDAESLRGKYNY